MIEIIHQGQGVLKALLNQERESLDYFFENIDIKAMEKLLDIMYECQGMIFFTGIGKSGLVAEKIAVTMTSIGTPALYISPTNALHGDLGIVTDKDLVLILSKSGESEELLHLIPSLRNKHVKIVSIVSNPKSRLAAASDFNLFLPLEKELCPFDLVPTVSTLVQMILGDVLAVGLMKKKKFTLDDYALNHPAGRIGKRITIRVEDLMIRGESLPLCSPKDKLFDTLVELSNKRCGCVLVVDEKMKLLGIFTDGDLRRALQNKGANVLEKEMQSLMNKKPRSINPNKLALEAMSLMEKDQRQAITVLPVIEEEKVVGLIKLHDIVQSGI